MTTLSPAYHSGIVVDDVQKAMAGIEADLGYVFNAPTDIVVPRFEDRIAGTVGEVRMSAAYSRTGPYRLELIAAQGDGIYSAERRGLHHVGVWESNITGRLRALENSATVTVEAVLWRADNGISAIYASSSVSGFRTEYVNADRREELERWFETGSLA